MRTSTTTPRPSRLRRAARPAIGLVVLPAWLAGCGESGGPAPGEPPLEADYAGCDTVFEGPECVLPEDRRLRLWVRSAAGAVIEIEGAIVLPGSPVEVQQGRRYEVEVPVAVPELAVRAEGREGRSASWRLALREPSAPAWLERTLELYRGGERAEAERLLHDELPELPPRDRGRALGLLARFEWFGERRGDEIARLWGEALREYRQSDRTFDRIDDATFFVNHLLHEARDLPAARTVLDSLPDDWGGPAESSYYLDFYRAQLAKELGDLRSALRHLEAAARRAERLGLERLRQTAEHPLAVMLQRLGRYPEAEAVARRLLRESPEPLEGCDRGKLLNNLAWMLLLAREAEEPSEDAAPLFEETLEVLRRHDCPQLESERVNVLLNLALAHLHAGRMEASRQALDRALSSWHLAEPRLELWRLDVEGRLALAGGEPADALALYGELARRAAAQAATEAEWRAAVGAAQAHSALGEIEPALAELDRAENLLDEMSLAVALHAGRGTFIARHHQATRLQLDLALEAGRTADALAVARRSRSRTLRDLRRQDRLATLSPREQEAWSRAIARYREERSALEEAAAGDWQLSADRLERLRADRQEIRRRQLEALDDAFAVLRSRRSRDDLPEPGDGELLLAYHPAQDGWVGFAAGRQAVVAERLACVDEGLSPEDLSACLLRPFAGRIEAAETVRVLPYGPLRAVDFHALPFGSGVLLASKPVVYPLDLPPAAEAARRGPWRALVVADARGDLPAARREARGVEAILKDGGGAWTVAILGGDDAAGDAVRRRLPEVDLFHFAGHAAFSGAGGWESGLPLAAGGRLTVGDVLALPRVPRWVVLSGCETGRAGADAPQEGIGLANAFAAAGSSRVVAAVRPVPDAVALALVQNLYREWTADAGWEVALQRAQLALRRADPEADWASFRLIEP